ncbi:MAG: polysaccharide biosynthesis tyrosine autokinase [Actinomycetota bacterium]|nr:polysaccharide biosynthesis tyrosine autokinase [Actinomycetota bacterium]
MTFAEYFVLLQRRWRIWTAGLMLGLLAAFGVSATMETEYTATATSFVTVAEPVDSGGQGEIFQGSQFAVQRVKSYAPLVESPDVLEPVIEELGLDLTSRQLARKVSVASAPETVLMDVSVADPDPNLAAALADAVSVQLGLVIEDLETARDGSQSNVKVSLARPANVPLQPSSPRILLNLALGAAAGLAAGLVAAVLRQHLDTRVKTPDDVRSLTDMSPLGATLHERGAARRPLVALDWRSASAERYRTVRTALKFATVDTDLRHFTVTSSVAEEGKTSVACNLAISWAQSGASVCLVEADLRRPGVSRFLGIDGSLGLSDVVVGDSRLDDVLVSWNHGMLTVLPAGSLPPDPAALLGSAAMASLIATLRDRFDVVIYDSPPLLSVTDGVVLGHQTDGVVLIIRAFSTRPEHVSTTVERLRSARVVLLGTVLTRERVRRRQRVHDYKPDLSRDRVELPQRPAANGDDSERPAGALVPGAPAQTNGVAFERGPDRHRRWLRPMGRVDL